MEYVIIGNSTAAVGCIEGIRSVDPEGAITVVASEPYHTYSRPLISYLLEGKTDGERMKYRPDSYYKEMGVKAKLGIKAVKLMPEEHKVVLEDGEELPYGKLLVATGSTPFVPSFEGLDTVEKKFTFLSLDDAKALEAALTPESRVLILGAGLIGLKCAGAHVPSGGHCREVSGQHRPLEKRRHGGLRCAGAGGGGAAQWFPGEGGWGQSGSGHPYG